MENIAFKLKLAEYLLQIKAIHLNLQNPYTWASGWKAPIYCDNRIILSYPDVREFVRDGLVMLINEYFNHADCIAGVATAGIAHAAIVANDLHLPMVYVRAKAKEHGKENLIEGELRHGTRVVVIEDTISTGGSSLKAIEDLRAAGAEVIGTCAIFKYGFSSTIEKFKDAGVPLKTLTNYDYVISIAKELKHINEQEILALQNWVQNPSAWNK